MGCSLKELLHVQVGWAHKFFAWVGFWHYCKHVVHTKLVRAHHSGHTVRVYPVLVKTNLMCTDVQYRLHYCLKIFLHV